MLKSTYTPPPPLPPGWTEHKAPSGHTYYYNAQTKQSTYKRPAPPVTPQPAPQPVQEQNPAYFAPGNLPPFSSTPYGPAGFGAAAFPSHYGPGRGGFKGGRNYQDRRRREPEDRPKSKHPIPNCTPWLLVKTKLGRRFVHNPETNESFWKFPQEVLKGVVEYDRIEREKKERRDRGEETEEEDVHDTVDKRDVSAAPSQPEKAEAKTGAGAVEDSDEYEEVEVTDSEGEEQPSKRPRTDDEAPEDGPIEFNEEDIEYQLAAMGEEYGLDPGEYGEPGEEAWEEGAEGLPLTEEDSIALFRDLLDDFQINPFTTWEKIIEEGRIIEDSRYTALPNMKSRREAWSNWSRDRIQDLKERKEKQEKKDPRIRYLAFLQEHATPKLYWPEFKRKFRKEPEMKDTKLSDKDKEKFYREHISRLKLPESTRKSDLSSLLKSVPLHLLNRSSSIQALPTPILTDIRYISLPPKVRDPLIEAYVSTLPPAPENDNMTAEEREELDKKRLEREKREKALAEREKRVEEEKRRQRSDLLRGKNLLREGEAEVEMAMKVGKEGLMSHMEPNEPLHEKKEGMAN
ncbi:hypothetical protein Plec18167_008494 [Paecilomyces lecythidis]|uniref:WW domain-containing protein n=1 Tax=Paecilomyces lecythidis TaxID=3004212 RepID=A0ABR3WWR9_9EURO